MAETDKSIAVRVQAHLRAKKRRAPARADIVAVLPTARENLARLIAGDRVRRQELRPATAATFQVAIENGEASLSTLLADPHRLLLEFLPQADVRNAADGQQLFYLSPTAYDLQQPSPWGYFTVEGKTIKARLAGEAAGASVFTANIIGNFVPDSSEIPPSCIPDITLITARLVDGGSEQPEEE